MVAPLTAAVIDRTDTRARERSMAASFDEAARWDWAN